MSHFNVILWFALKNGPFWVYTSRKWLNSNSDYIILWIWFFLFLLILVSCCLVQFWRSYRLHRESQHWIGNIHIGQGFPKIWQGTTIHAFEENIHWASWVKKQWDTFHAIRYQQAGHKKEVPAQYFSCKVKLCQILMPILVVITNQTRVGDLLMWLLILVLELTVGRIGDAGVIYSSLWEE